MEIFKNVLGIISLLCLVCLLLGLPLMLLWNWLMPIVFNLPTITFWQAVGINVLASIIFPKSITIKSNQ
jgi:hypothetical protein